MTGIATGTLTGKLTGKLTSSASSHTTNIEVVMASEEIGKLPEWVKERQRAFQSVDKLTHLKAPSDRLTSVIIPGLLVATGLSLMGRGIYHMATGQGLKA